MRQRRLPVQWTIVAPLIVSAVVATTAADTLTVGDCVRLALARAPAVQAAGFDATAAAARVRAARAAYGPRLLATGEYGRSEGFDEVVTNGGSTAALLTLETTLLDGGLRAAQLAAARARLQSADAIERQRRADVTLTVRTAYFVAVAARADAAIEGDQVRALRDAVDLLRRQERLGLVPYNDVLRAQLAGTRACAAERDATARLTAARDELHTLTSVEIDTAALAEPERMRFLAPTDALIAASPVMADAHATLEAARRDTDAARSERRGHFMLTASAGALGVQPGPTFHDNGGGQFLFGVTMPLFDGGTIAARIAAAAAAANSAEASVQQVRQTLAIALARAGVDARRAQADLAAWQRAVPQAAEHFQLMRARYFGGGNVRLLEVLDALTEYIDARLNVPHALLAYRIAVATEEQILGETPP